MVVLFRKRIIGLVPITDLIIGVSHSVMPLLSCASIVYGITENGVFFRLLVLPPLAQY